MNNSGKPKPIPPPPLGPGGQRVGPFGPGGQNPFYIPCSECPSCKPKISDDLNTLTIVILVLSALILILPTFMYMLKAYKKS